MNAITSKTKTPSYRLHRSSGQAVVTLNGKDVYLGAYLSPESRKRYDTVIAEWLARGRQPVRAEAAALSVAELADVYLDWAEGYYLDRDGKPKRNEIWHVKRAIKPLNDLFGITAAADFGPRGLEAVRDKLVADGLCRSLCNKYTRRVRDVFRLGVAKELIPGETWHRLSAVQNLKRGHCEAPETEPVTPVADAHVDAIRPHVSRQVWAMIEVQRLTGMRPGEIAIMRGCDLDMSGPLWQYRPEHHKTEHHGKGRVIVLGARAQAIIRPFLTTDLEGYLFRPRDVVQERREARTKERKTPVNQGNSVGSNRKRRPQKRPGLHYSSTSYRRAIATGCDKADTAAKAEAIAAGREIKDGERLVPQWHPNQLRHSFATRVRREFGLEEAQVALGHSRADVTQLYAEKNLRLAATVALKIG